MYNDHFPERSTEEGRRLFLKRLGKTTKQMVSVLERGLESLGMFFSDVSPQVDDSCHSRHTLLNAGITLRREGTEEEM